MHKMENTDLPIDVQLEAYKIALSFYRLSYVLPKKYFNTVDGFCWYFKNTYRSKLFKDINNYTILMSLKPEDSGHFYWFTPGILKPRIEILKEAIKICKRTL